MATDIRTRTDKHGTIAFTLPISCQICLGKVRKPVLCPNNHVFCSPCMDLWLQRNQQCPACRTPIDTENPLKHVIGGLNHIENDKDKMSNPDMRRARFDLVFKEYEEEFESVSSELTLIKSENEMLRNQLTKEGSKKGLGPRDKYLDSSAMLTLTKKLQDAQKLYEKVKSDLSKVKEENNNLKDENINLNHENQKLRFELAGRSPHRYGRYTVSTLETKVQNLEKENGRLNKAMEKSDKYIEDLERELEICKGKGMHSSASQQNYKASHDEIKLETSRENDNPSKRQLFTDSSKDLVHGESYRHALDDEYLKLYKSTKLKLKTKDCDIDDNDYLSSYQSKSYTNSKTNGKSGKRVTFDLPSDKNVTTSFDLEMPSPMKQNASISVSSPVKGVLKNGKKSGSTCDSLDLSKPSLDDGKNYRSSSRDDIDIYIPKSKTDMGMKEDALKQSFKSQNHGSLNDSFSLENPRQSWRTNKEFDDTQQIQRELDDLDISLTPDFTDCMKLLNRAEKKVHDMNEDSSMDLSANHNGGDFMGDYKTKYLPQYRSKDRRFVEYKTNELPEYRSKARLLDDISSTRSYVPESNNTSLYYSTDIPACNGDLYQQSSIPSYNAVYQTTSTDCNQPGSLPSDQRYNLSTDIGQYEQKSSLDAYKSNDDARKSYSSAINKKYPSSLRFGRSPSLDNLFTSKPAQNSWSRFATAEDIPCDYKLRGDHKVCSSLPDYSTAKVEDDRLGKDYMASLHSRPIRARSYSDIGTSVSSLPRGKTGFVSNNESSTNQTNNVPSIPVSSALYSVDCISTKPPLYTSNSQQIVGGPIKAHVQQTFAYTDVDLGVNPRNRAQVDGLRTRSSSLDIPLTDISKYSSIKSNPEYAVSFSGPKVSLDGYTRTWYSSTYMPSSSTTTSALKPIQESAYSYVSNNSSLGNGTDSYLPEPKKRLFDSCDDLEMSLSPIKATCKK